MMEAGIVRHASGDWNPGDSHVRLRIEADRLDQPQDFLIAVADVQPLIVLLLMLSGKAGKGLPRDAGAESRPTLPLPLNSVGLGETEDGDTVLQLDIGQTALAFAMPAAASRKLGQSLLTLSARSTSLPAN